MITEENNLEEINCADCNKKLETAENAETKSRDIIGGKLLKYKIHDTGKVEEDYLYIFKCDECFTKDPALRNYQKCEVYSRVVGYIRPVQQWNKGKVEEYEERKLFKEPGYEQTRENVQNGEGDKQEVAPSDVMDAPIGAGDKGGGEEKTETGQTSSAQI